MREHLTALHFLVVRGHPLLAARLVPDRAPSVLELRMSYRTGTALLPRLMEICTRRGFRILQVEVDRLPGSTDPAARVLLELEADVRAVRERRRAGCGDDRRHGRRVETTSRAERAETTSRSVPMAAGERH
ncbi:hypothetical protein ACFW08_14745 [Streptomyces sp. NPDC058960]|uniref:hypothetical protein n=1 Tax=Streptomyces sp. NPDC058960 TaxID=3346679 RepID=UPI0036B0C2A7